LNEEECLFIKKINDLYNITYNNGDKLQSSAILRLFYLDGITLIDSVNKIHRKKLIYRFHDPKFRKRLLFNSLQFGFDNLTPNEAHSSFTSQRTKEQFLNTEIVVYQGNTFSVKETIKYLANKFGGIHHDLKKRDIKETLFSKMIEVQSHSIVDKLMIEISIIVISTLKDLKNAILENHLKNFTRAKGLTLWMPIRILTPPDSGENYIVDIGKDINKSRLSLFVDTDNNLTLRYISSSKQIYKISQKLKMNIEIILNLGIYKFETKLLLYLDVDNWVSFMVVEHQYIDEFLDNYTFVLGSDINLRREGYFHLASKYVFNRRLEVDDKLTLERHVLKAWEKCAIFNGIGQYIHSENHPKVISCHN